MNKEQQMAVGAILEKYDNVSVKTSPFDGSIMVFAHKKSVWNGYVYTPPIYKGWEVSASGDLRIIGERLGDTEIWGAYTYAQYIKQESWLMEDNLYEEGEDALRGIW